MEITPMPFQKSEFSFITKPHRSNLYQVKALTSAAPRSHGPRKRRQIPLTPILTQIRGKPCKMRFTTPKEKSSDMWISKTTGRVLHLAMATPFQRLATLRLVTAPESPISQTINCRLDGTHYH